MLTSLDSAKAIILSAVEEFSGALSVLTSFQREGIVIVDLVNSIAPQVPVVTIDTGRLPAETYAVLDAVERRFGIEVRRIVPDAGEVSAMVAAHGIDLFRDGVAERMLCCQVRKVRPLAAHVPLGGACFIGLRREQNLERSELEVFDRSGGTVRISPLADWSAAEVLEYTKSRDLPEHPLYAAGYRSIGCGPCTRAVGSGEDERAGRWWWEDEAAKECGLHFSPDGRAERKVDFLLRDLLSRTEAA